MLEWNKQQWSTFAICMLMQGTLVSVKIELENHVSNFFHIQLVFSVEFNVIYCYSIWDNYSW